MCYFYLIDCVANAIIEKEKLSGRKNVLLDEAISYEECVIDLLNDVGYFAKMKVINDASILFFEKEYQDYFEIYYDKEGNKGYILREDKNILELEKLARSNLDDNIVLYFSHDSAVNKLNICKYYKIKKSLRKPLSQEYVR